MSAKKAEPTTAQATLAARVSELRARRGYSLRELSRRLGDLGHPLDPSTLLRLERAERHATLEDVLALALALDVAPVHLFVPFPPETPVAVTPTTSASAGHVRAWVRGERPLEGVDKDTYRRETPAAWYERETGLEQRLADAMAAEDAARRTMHEAEREFAAMSTRLDQVMQSDNAGEIAVAQEQRDHAHHAYATSRAAQATAQAAVDALLRERDAVERGY